MRLWSIHPKYLDSAALTACWRESLLARKVLMGQTRGYKNHPQLTRFKKNPEPLIAINTYLNALLTEAQSRGYNFDKNKISPNMVDNCLKINVTQKQVDYEFSHLLVKLRQRALKLYEKLKVDNNKIEPHPLFMIIDGEIEEWEKIK